MAFSVAVTTTNKIENYTTPWDVTAGGICGGRAPQR
jgi:hypothetical protein